MESNNSWAHKKKVPFLNCEFSDSDFKGTFLYEASFEGSFFRGTVFHNANLEKASFVNAHGYNIDPRVNKIKKAVFSAPDVLSLLSHLEIVIKNWCSKIKELLHQWGSFKSLLLLKES